MRHPFLAAAFAIGLLLPTVGPRSAQAGPIFVSEVSSSNGSQSVTVSGGALGSPQSAYAGQFTLTANPGTVNDPASHATLLAWCVDLLHTISLGVTSLVFQEGALTQAGAGGPSLSAQQVAQIGWLADYGNTQLASGPDSLLSAAVQTAIWNVAYGSTYTGGDPAMSQALNNLSALLPANPTGLTVTALVPQAQGQMLVTVSKGPVAVPEPGSLGLFGLALAGLLAARRRAMG